MQHFVNPWDLLVHLWSLKNKCRNDKISSFWKFAFDFDFVLRFIHHQCTGRPRYMGEIGSKNLLYNEFAFKKTKDAYKLGDMFLKKAYFQSHLCKIADKKPAYNEVCLYVIVSIDRWLHQDITVRQITSYITGFPRYSRQIRSVILDREFWNWQVHF